MTPSSDQSGGLRLSVSSAVATIIFDRPAARNAMLFRTWLTLPGLIAVAEADPAVRVIVIRGNDGHFGAGNDIAEFGRLRGDAAAASDYGWAMARAMRAVESASCPVIAAIEGSCFGASVALALCADIRLAAADARFAITPAKLGALYLRSDHHRLVAAMGPGQARRMIFTAQTLNAAEAQAIGLVDSRSAEPGLERELAQLTEDICRGSPYTLDHSKRTLRGVNETPDETDESIGWFAAAMQGADFAEGVEAFLAKRLPAFASIPRSA